MWWYWRLLLWICMSHIISLRYVMCVRAARERSFHDVPIKCDDCLYGSTGNSALHGSAFTRFHHRHSTERYVFFAFATIYVIWYKIIIKKTAYFTSPNPSYRFWLILLPSWFRVCTEPDDDTERMRQVMRVNSMILGRSEALQSSSFDRSRKACHNEQ